LSEKNFRVVCEKNINPKIQNHIIVQVKDNQKNLHKECLNHLDKYKISELFSTSDFWRNRNEYRTYKKYEFTTDRSEFVTTLITVERITDKVYFEAGKRKIKQTKEQSIYISSINLPIQRLAEIIRNHRWIENKLHHILDVNFWEDASRIRTKPENMSLIKCITNNILRMNWETCIKKARFCNGITFDRILKYKHLI